MSLFIESIRLEDGALHNLHYHNLRTNRTRRELLGIRHEINLDEYIHIPGDYDSGLYKCRVTYGEQIVSVELEEYVVRRPQLLKLVEGKDIDYAYKYADRTALDALYEERENCDDILIIKEGRVTDTSYANVAFYDGKDWITPDTPLLKGTRRQELLDNGLITEGPILVGDMDNYQRILLFNAMIPFDTDFALHIDQIMK